MIKPPQFRQTALLLFLLAGMIFRLGAQEIKVILKTGKEIEGKLVSLTVKEVQIDPEGAVSFLSLDANSISSLEFTENGQILKFPIAESEIPANLPKTNNKKVSTSNSSYFEHYWGWYLFGGFSSKKTLYTESLYSGGQNYLVDVIYKNGALGGIGAEYLYDTKNNPIDFIVDAEMAIIGAEFLTTVTGSEMSIMKGTVITADVGLNVFPFQARNVDYPAPFAFVGLGLRLIGFEDASEIHAALPFGVGLRFQVTKGIAIQIKERFVYSTLDDVDNFILPETRFEIHFDISQW
jgi:hypothetical protein